MPSPPKDISRHFDYSAILEPLGIPVKHVLPEVTICPICRKDTLAVYLDPIVGGNTIWLNCKNCEYGCDALEFYAKVNEIEDLREAVYRAMATGVCKAAPSDVTGDVIDSYIDNIKADRDKAVKVVDSLRKNILRDTPTELVDRLQLEHLWAGWTSRFLNRITRYVGGTTRLGIKRTFGLCLPKDRYDTVLTIPFQDVPHRLCALQFYGEKDKSLKFFTKHLSGKGEGGIAMLENLDIYEKVVYAMGDTRTALQMHRKQLADVDTPLKLILFNDLTNFAWTSVRADKVILWDLNIDWRLFVHAKKVKNGYITDHPKITRTEDTFQYMSEEPLGHVLGLMERHALPWQDFLIKWVMSGNITDTAAKDLLSRLTLEPEEKEDLLARCKDVKTQDKLAYYLQEVKGIHTVNINNFNIAELEDGWYATHPLKKPALITNATIKVYREINDTVHGMTYWHGAIVFKGVLIDFKTKVSDIEEDPVTWLRTRIAMAGMGMPEIQNRWARYLILMAQRFSKPKTDVACSSIGLSTDRSFTMPRFRLINGEAKIDQIFCVDDSMPAMNILPPIKRKHCSSDTVTSTHAAVYAGMAAMVSNWVAKINNLPVRPILIAGEAGTVGQVAARHLAAVSGMHVHKLHKVEDVWPARERLNGFEYPVYLEPTNPGVLAEYPTNNNDNVMLNAGMEDATCLSVGGQWVVISAPALRRDTSALPPIDDMIWYIADLQLRNFELPPADNLVDAVLEDLFKFLSRYLEQDQAELFKLAKQMLSVPSQPSNDLMTMLFWLYRSGKVDINYRSINVKQAKKFVVTHDSEQAITLIYKPLLLEAVKKYKLPTPNLSTVTEDFANKGVILQETTLVDGWIIKRSHWNDHSQIWKDTFGADLKLT